ncbi:membrane protein [soil metagenome]
MSLAASLHLARRLAQLLVGLALYGVSLALLLRAGLGLAPWDVLHQGIAEWLDVSIGLVLIAVSFLVLLLWIPLRERPGFGTVANALLVGVFVDLTLLVVGDVTGWPWRVSLLLVGVALNGVATALYIGATLGPGPRDGLMTGLVRRTGRSVRLVRTVIEATVLILGWLLGGTVGIGTVLYAVAIGPIAHALLPVLTVPPRALPDREVTGVDESEIT